MIDRTTKLLLAAIAIGLFFNGMVSLVQPAVVVAEETEMQRRGRGPQIPRVRGNLQGEQREQYRPPTETPTDKWLSWIYAAIDNQTNVLASRLP